MYLSPSTTSTLNHAAKMNQDYLPFMDHVICGLAYLPRRIESYIPTLKKRESHHKYTLVESL